MAPVRFPNVSLSNVPSPSFPAVYSTLLDLSSYKNFIYKFTIDGLIKCFDLSELVSESHNSLILLF